MRERARVYRRRASSGTHTPCAGWLAAAPGEVERIKTVALCHPSCTTNGRTCSTVAGSHKPYGSHRVHPRCGPRSLCFTLTRSLTTSGSYSLSLSLLYLSLSLSLCLSRSTFMRCAFHMALYWLLPFSRLLSVSPPLSLYLSIVHNYTIRLLNRLMRPPLPVVAAPFTETTGRARASLLSLPPSFRLAHVLEILKLSPTYPLACFFPARVCPLACPDFLTRALPAPSIHALFSIILLLISANVVSNAVINVNDTSRYKFPIFILNLNLPEFCGHEYLFLS